MADLACGDQWRTLMAGLHPRTQALRARSEHPLAIDLLLLFRALPDHAGKPLQRHQRLAGIGPFLQLLDRDVIERLAAGAPRKQRARDVDHVRRARALVSERRAAVRAEAAHGLCRLVLVPRDVGVAPGDAEALAPAADIGRIRRAMGAPACRRMIVPGPARGHIDLEADVATEALALGRLAQCDGFWFFGRDLVLREHLTPSQISSFRGDANGSAQSAAR